MSSEIVMIRAAQYIELQLSSAQCVQYWNSKELLWCNIWLAFEFQAPRIKILLANIVFGSLYELLLSSMPTPDNGCVYIAGLDAHFWSFAEIWFLTSVWEVYDPKALPSHSSSVFLEIVMDATDGLIDFKVGMSQDYKKEDMKKNTTHGNNLS